MNQPKKLPTAIDYSGEIYLPEIDPELSDFLTLHSEALDSHLMQEDLKEFDINYAGENVLLTNENDLDSDNFEEKIEKAPEESKKSFIKKLIH